MLDFMSEKRLISWRNAVDKCCAAYCLLEHAENKLAKYAGVYCDDIANIDRGDMQLSSSGTVAAFLVPIRLNRRKIKYC